MPSLFTCKTCGAKVEGFAPFMAHARAHVERGEATPVGRHGEKGKRGKAAPVGDDPPPAVERPLPDDPEAPPWFVQDVPPHLTAAGEPVDDDDPAIAGRVSRERLRVELDQPLLAEIIRNLSVVLSDWDGAGEAGQFSRIEAGQLAMLLHEPTLDLVDRYFGGNVNRFRLGIAAVIILLGKGRVHAKAIRARAAERRAAGEAVDVEILAAQSAAAQPTPMEVTGLAPVSSNGHTPPAEPLDPIAQLAERQRRDRTRGAAE